MKTYLGTVVSLPARQNKVAQLERKVEALEVARARLMADVTGLLDEREVLKERIRQLESRKHAEPARHP